MRYVAALVLTLAFAPAASADSITFELLPASGAISGDAGSTIGWGYSVTNDSEYWLELTGIGADSFEHALADASPFDYAILAPGVTHSVAFDAVALLGLYQLTWDALAPAGFTNAGLFVLSAAFWDGDPFASGAFVSEAPTLSAGYSASVNPVPEPGTLLLLGSGAAIAALARRRMR